MAGLEEELARLGVSKALLAETMGEKEEETTRRLREAKDKQVHRRTESRPWIAGVKFCEPGLGVCEPQKLF